MAQQVRALAVKFPTLTSKLGRDSSLGQKKKKSKICLYVNCNRQTPNALKHPINTWANKKGLC